MRHAKPGSSIIVDAQRKAIKTYDRKKDADAYHATVSVEIAAGTQRAPSKSVDRPRGWAALDQGRRGCGA